jgi:hypothetical protein
MGGLFAAQIYQEIVIPTIVVGGTFSVTVQNAPSSSRPSQAENADPQRPGSEP